MSEPKKRMYLTLWQDGDVQPDGFVSTVDPNDEEKTIADLLRAALLSVGYSPVISYERPHKPDAAEEGYLDIFNDDDVEETE